MSTPFYPGGLNLVGPAVRRRSGADDREAIEKAAATSRERRGRAMRLPTSAAAERRRLRRRVLRDHRRRRMSALRRALRALADAHGFLLCCIDQPALRLRRDGGGRRKRARCASRSRPPASRRASASVLQRRAASARWTRRFARFHRRAAPNGEDDRARARPRASRRAAARDDDRGRGEDSRPTDAGRRIRSGSATRSA